MATPLDPGVAETRLRAMTQASLDPTLDGDELLMCLELSRRPDADGRAPSDPEWAPTWHLAAGAAEGWRLKAGKVAHRVDAAADGGSVRRSQLHAHCLAMARRYAASGGIVAAPLTGRGELSRAAMTPVVNLAEPEPFPGAA